MTLRTVVTLALAAGSVCGPHLKAQPQTVVDVEKVGPQVGDMVPDFTAVDAYGRPRTLRSLYGPNGLMLVFFRSADW